MTVAVVVDENEDELQSSLSILKSTEQFEAVYGFIDPGEASCFIQERGCGILFLETEIKGINCFVLIDKLRKIRQDILFIIMATREDYAYEAFQKGIVDYVLKPLSPEGVAKTLDKIRKYHKMETYSYCNGRGLG